MFGRPCLPVRGGFGDRISQVDEPLQKEVTQTLLNIINGRNHHPIEISPNDRGSHAEEFINTFNLFLSKYQEMVDFVQEISKGNLDADPPIGRFKALDNLKGIHSNLRHLTWQTHRVAEGDYNQQVDFLGDFSISFNKMTRQLKESFEKIETQKLALEDANRFLEDMNMTDPLTGLGNRRAFDGALSLEWRQGERDQSPLSLIMLDIDSFKKFNDNYGHQEGDDCIRRVAKTINRHIKRPRDLAARYGGEEFAVILSATSTEGASVVAENIRYAVEEMKIPHLYSVATDVVTLSVGVATLIPTIGPAPESLVKKADKALYSAKNLGRNQVVVAERP